MSDRSKNTMELELGLEIDDIISGKDEPETPAGKSETIANQPEIKKDVTEVPAKSVPKSNKVISTENNVLSSVTDFLNSPAEEDEWDNKADAEPATAKAEKTVPIADVKIPAVKIVEDTAEAEKNTKNAEPVKEEAKPFSYKTELSYEELKKASAEVKPAKSLAKEPEAPKKKAEKPTVKEEKPSKNVFADDAEIPEEIFAPAVPEKDDGDELIDDLPDPRIEEELLAAEAETKPAESVTKEKPKKETKAVRPEVKTVKSNKKSSFFSPALSRSLDRIIAIVPLIAWAVYAYGVRVLATVLISAVSFIVFDLLLDLILNKKTDAASGDSLFCGMAVSLVFPPAISPLVILFVTFCAAVIKHIFNRNALVSFNPYATAVTLAFITFPAKMTAYLPFGEKGAFSEKIVTDIEKLLSGALPDTTLWDALFGVTSGGIGEISGFLIILALIWLAVRKNAASEIAVSYIITVAVFSYFLPGLIIETDIIVIKYALFQLLCGGTLFTAVFFASDPAYAPRSFRAKIAIGVIGGLFLMLCRKYVGGIIPCAVSVVAMNLFAPFLDMIFSDGEIFGGKPTKSTK